MLLEDAPVSTETREGSELPGIHMLAVPHPDLYDAEGSLWRYRRTANARVEGRIRRDTSPRNSV